MDYTCNYLDTLNPVDNHRASVRRNLGRGLGLHAFSIIATLGFDLALS